MTVSGTTHPEGKRRLAALLALVLCFTGALIRPMGQAHAEGPAEAATPEPQAVLTVTVTLAPTAVPTDTPEPSPAPTPSPTPEPTATPEPTPDPDRPMVALTFDDGPRENGTAHILDLLEQYGGRATFFVLGVVIKEETAPLLQRMVDLGCEIGIHGLDHSKISKMSYENQVRRLTKAKTIISERIEGGYEPRIMRPPGGSNSRVVERAAGDMGLSVILWSVDTADWKSANPEAILKICRQQIKNGSIVLFHDKLKATGVAMERLLPWLQEQGYELVTVSELLESRGVPLEPGRTYQSKSFD